MHVGSMYCRFHSFNCHCMYIFISLPQVHFLLPEMYDQEEVIHDTSTKQIWYHVYMYICIFTFICLLIHLFVYVEVLV